jgi:hypothetical protein
VAASRDALSAARRTTRGDTHTPITQPCDETSSIPPPAHCWRVVRRRRERALVSGCVTVGPDFKTPDVTLEDPWYERLSAAAQAVPANDAAWSNAFDDPVLTALEARAAERTLSVRITGLHIFKARAVRDQRAGSAAPSACPNTGNV